MEKVILYTTHCPMCRQIERQLDMKKIEYEKCDDQEKMREMGFKQAPMLSVDGELMDFRAALAWIKAKEA